MLELVGLRTPENLSAMWMIGVEYRSESQGKSGVHEAALGWKIVEYTELTNTIIKMDPTDTAPT